MSATYPFPKRAESIRRKHAGYVAAQIAGLSIDRDYVVTIKQATKDRTTRQNRYLHALIGEIAKAAGMTAEDAKDALALKFLGAESEREIGGVVMTQRVSTAKLSTAECARFCDELRAWAGQFLGLVLPLPEEFCE